MTEEKTPTQMLADVKRILGPGVTLKYMQAEHVDESDDEIEITLQGADHPQYSIQIPLDGDVALNENFYTDGEMSAFKIVAVCDDHGQAARCLGRILEHKQAQARRNAKQIESETKNDQ